MPKEGGAFRTWQRRAYGGKKRGVRDLRRTPLGADASAEEVNPPRPAIVI
jgi:hypothetical protein